MRRGYIFTDRRTSHRAVMAVILGIISMVSLGVSVFYAYEGSGELPVKYGVTGLLSGIYSFIGLVLGIVTVCDKGYYKFFPVLGVILNVIVLAGEGLILYMGVG